MAVYDQNEIGRPSKNLTETESLDNVDVVVSVDDDGTLWDGSDGDTQSQKS